MPHTIRNLIEFGKFTFLRVFWSCTATKWNRFTKCDKLKKSKEARFYFMKKKKTFFFCFLNCFRFILFFLKYLYKKKKRYKSLEYIYKYVVPYTIWLLFLRIVFNFNIFIKIMTWQLFLCFLFLRLTKSKTEY